MIYVGLFFMSGIILAKYSEIIPREKKINDETSKINVIMKN